MLTKTTPGLTNQTAYTYDQPGYQGDARFLTTTVTTPDGASQTTSLDLLLGRTVASQTASLTRALMSYDAQGFLSQTTDPTGVVTRFTHDRFGEVTATQTHADGANPIAWVSVSRTYDLAGNLTDITDRRGKTVHLAYENNGPTDASASGRTT